MRWLATSTNNQKVRTMKKIMFNDRYGLTEAVLSGRKTQARRICKHDRPDETYDIAFPIFGDKDFDDEGNPISSLYGAFCWGNEAGEFTGLNIPVYKDGDVVAVAQRYKDIYNDECDPRQFPSGAGWTNKMFVRADLMPHRIRITNLRIERLQDIPDEDCIKEGIYKDESTAHFNGYAFEIFKDQHGNILAKKWHKTPREAYADLIDRISGKGTWERNPWVFVYDFELIK